MKKKILLGLMFLLSTITVFAQFTDESRSYWELDSKLFPIPLEKISVPGHPRAVGKITYIGKNSMEQNYRNYVQLFQRHGLYRIKRMETNIKLLKEEENAINMLLHRYNTSKGDTFTIVLNAIRYEYCIYIILEFSSDTQYSYYVWGEG